MLKIKKGIKKKIKGKKGKNDELFTPEELEQYKREKEEEARRLAGQQQQQQQQQPETEEEKENIPGEAEPAAPEQEGATGTSETQEASSSKEDWRSFFAATDTVLKKTTDNLNLIKEASYFQKKEELSQKEVEVVQETSVEAPSPATTSGKRWVDLEKGGIDEESQDTSEEVKETEEPEPEPKSEPELAPLQFIEDLPDVDVDDFTEVFDTTYVDNVESGQVKLHYIPDSPTTEDPNEPDPFDTSVFDKVLHVEEPKPKETNKKKPEPEKKKKQLVNLGCAVEVLTGKVQTADKPSGTPPPDSKRRRVIPKEINLLADAAGEENLNTQIGEEENDKENDTEDNTTKELDGNILDDILCVTDAIDLPDTSVVLCPTPRATSPSVLSEDGKTNENAELVAENYLECENKEVDLSEFLESNGEDHDNKESKDSGKDLDLKDLVAEFDIIDKSEVINETLIPTEPDPIEDEFDAEFAFLAAESVAKAKEKELTDLEDDPFDTSAAAQVLGPEETQETEKDPFDVGFAEEALGETVPSGKPVKPPPPRPAFPTANKVPEEVDPFDTSIADAHLPVDHLASPEATLDLPATLQPHSGADISKSESFDPFDTSIAETFGKTELKVLETELLTTDQKHGKSLKEEDIDDFYFNPRAEEPETQEKPSPPCLLTAGEEEVESGPVLTPSQEPQEDDFDPFDTSIAAKVAIKSLEAELLSDSAQPSSDKKQPPPRRPPSPGHIFATTPTDTNPALQPFNVGDQDKSVDTEIDPFDTSIAENFGKTELKALADELLTSDQPSQVVPEVEKERPDTKSLQLPVKPLHPPSPKCLLAATPVDEHPTLKPTLEPTDNNSNTDDKEFDPFDTSIADQFGKTELKVLETELLVAASNPVVEEFDDFNPRAEADVPTKPSKPSRPPSPAQPQCLLTATPAGSPPGAELLAPTEFKTSATSEDFDPFDTSIAEKFGKTELKQLESELLSSANTVTVITDDFDPRGEETKKPPVPQKPSRPGRPAVPAAPCLLATTPTDQSVPLQPSLNTAEEPKAGVTPEDFDPFDTSIAEKLCKTEIEALEETLFTNSSTEADIKTAANLSLATSNAPSFSADHFLSSSPTENLGPTLQPVQGQQEEEPKDFDPFDTSIAEKFGKTELKTLESELLSDSGVKRNLSDDEFDPREEETKLPKRPSPPIQKPDTPVNLLDSAEDHNITVQPLQASKQQTAENLEADYDPFDTSIAANIGPSKAELKYLESELLSAAEDPFDTSNIA
ncbi:protein stoned-A-like [Macrobrachium nipponense]|uniref:protein stoned-A-like n=1 Tax=Macrobrachium nipponense TaxID=159736 RepID=UPI0030C7C3D5